MKTRTAVSRPGTGTRTDERVDTQLHRLGISVLGVSAFAIGLWAVAALIGGMVASGGPLALVANWFKAVFGM